MEYQAVGNRCAVAFNDLDVPTSRQETLTLLAEKGIMALDVDIIALARRCIGVSRYCRGVQTASAPAVVDCSSFTKWLYSKRGIWIPRLSIQQRQFGIPVPLDECIAGDLVFTSAPINYYHDDSADGVGHVGIVTEEGTVIHAANGKANVVEAPFEEFLGKSFRGICRYIPQNADVVTFQFPPERELETSDDIRWAVLSCLPLTWKNKQAS